MSTTVQTKRKLNPQINHLRHAICDTSHRGRRRSTPSTVLTMQHQSSMANGRHAHLPANSLWQQVSLSMHNLACSLTYSTFWWPGQLDAGSAACSLWLANQCHSRVTTDRWVQSQRSICTPVCRVLPFLHRNLVTCCCCCRLYASMLCSCEEASIMQTAPKESSTPVTRYCCRAPQTPEAYAGSGVPAKVRECHCLSHGLACHPRIPQRVKQWNCSDHEHIFLYDVELK